MGNEDKAQDTRHKVQGRHKGLNAQEEQGGPMIKKRSSKKKEEYTG